MKTQWNQYKQILHKFVIPALGCTEPISVAYAAAHARALFSSLNQPFQITVIVSDNLYKNAMGVFIPGSGTTGIPMAAGLGVICGDKDANLEVLHKLTQYDVEHVKEMIANKQISVKRDTVHTDPVFCQVKISTADHTAIVEIIGEHTNITKKVFDGKILYEHQNSGASLESPLIGIDISVKQIYEYATSAPLDELTFILSAAEINTKLSEEGLLNSYGLSIGKTFQKNIENEILGNGLLNITIMKTTAASDARMGGAKLPAMTNYGSGNQGIVATLPVIIASKHFKSSSEELTRALIMSHLLAIYIKSFYPPLSAFCGTTVTAAAVSMAIVYLAHGNYSQGCFAMQNVISDTTGMICDGAKATCSMKVKSSTSSAVFNALMALDDHDVIHQGIVADNIETTIRNVGKLVSDGMKITDKVIIDIMASY